MRRVIGAIIGALFAIIGACAAVITVGQFFGFLPQRLVTTLPTLSLSGNLLLVIAAVLMAVGLIAMGFLLLRRSFRRNDQPVTIWQDSRWHS